MTYWDTLAIQAVILAMTTQAVILLRSAGLLSLASGACVGFSAYTFALLALRLHAIVKFLFQIA